MSDFINPRHKHNGQDRRNRTNKTGNSQPANEPKAATVDSRWKGLLKVGGLAPIALVAIVTVEFIIITVWPPPTTVLGWFTLFQKNMALALLDYPILDAAVIALLGPMFLALYFVLRRANETYVTIAVPFVFAGIASYWATTTAFSMLYLSDEYATATTDAQRSLFLAAGQALISTGLGGLFSSMGFLLITIAGLIVSIAMLRSTAFNKGIAIIGIVANILTLSNYVGLALVPTTISYFSPEGIVGGILLFAWWVLIGLRLYQIGSSLPSR